MLYEPLVPIIEEIQNKVNNCRSYRLRRLKAGNEEDEESFNRRYIYLRLFSREGDIIEDGADYLIDPILSDIEKGFKRYNVSVDQEYFQTPMGDQEIVFIISFPKDLFEKLDAESSPLFERLRRHVNALANEIAKANKLYLGRIYTTLNDDESFSDDLDDYFFDGSKFTELKKMKKKDFTKTKNLDNEFSDYFERKRFDDEAVSDDLDDYFFDDSNLSNEEDEENEERKERFYLDDNYIKELNNLVRKAKRNLREEVLNFIKHPYVDRGYYHPDRVMIQRYFDKGGTNVHHIYLAFDKKIPKYRIRAVVDSLIEDGLVEEVLKKTFYGSDNFLIPTEK